MVDKIIRDKKSAYQVCPNITYLPFLCRGGPYNVADNYFANESDVGLQVKHNIGSLDDKPNPMCLSKALRD